MLRVIAAFSGVFLLALPSVLAAQVTSGSAATSGAVQIGVGGRAASTLMGLTAYNQTYAESTTVINAMQVVYSAFQQKTSIPVPTGDPCSALVGGKFYVIGGYGASATTYLDNVQVYDPVTDGWAAGPTKTTAEWGAGCAAIGAVVYTFGGETAAGYGNYAEAFDTGTSTWSTCTSLPTIMGDGVMATTVGSYVYVMWDGTLYKVDPSSGCASATYTSLATAPSACRVRWAASGYFQIGADERIYYVGGSVGGPPNYTNAVCYYSITSNTWTGPLANPAPYTAHGELREATYGGSLFYVAGYDGSVFYDQLYAYTPDAGDGTWSTAIASMNAFRDGVAGGFYGDTLYVMGGRNANAPNAFGMADNEAYTLSNSPISQTLTKLRLHYTQASPSGSVRLGIYADSSGSPGSLILDAGAATIVNGWTSITGLSQTLMPGTRYWLAFIQSATNGVDYTGGKPYNPTGGAGSHCFATASYGALPSTFPSTGLDCTGDNSMYAIQLTQ